MGALSASEKGPKPTLEHSFGYVMRFWRESLQNSGRSLRVDPDPNLPEFCLFLFFAEFYFLTVLIFWIKSSKFCWFLFFENIGITFFDVLIFGIPKFSRLQRSKINVNTLYTPCEWSKFSRLRRGIFSFSFLFETS